MPLRLSQADRHVTLVLCHVLPKCRSQAENTRAWQRIDRVKHRIATAKRRLSLTKTSVLL